MSNSAEEIESGRASAERAVRELCQAQRTKQPRLDWSSAPDQSQRLAIVIEGLAPIELEFDLSALVDHGGMAAARIVRTALLAALRAR